MIEFNFTWKIDSSLFFETTNIYFNSPVYNCVYQNCGFNWYIRLVETEPKKKNPGGRTFHLYYKHGPKIKVRVLVSTYIQEIIVKCVCNAFCYQNDCLPTLKVCEKSHGIPILTLPYKISKECLTRFIDGTDKININCKLLFDESEFDVRLTPPIIFPVPLVGERLFMSAIGDSVEEYFSDVTIVSKDGKNFHCHKSYLAAGCEYFLSLFKNFCTSDPCDNVIKFKDFDSKIISEILKFIYTNQISDEISLFAHDLVYAADKFKLERLKIHCEIAMFDTVNRQNAVAYLIVAHRLELITVKDKSVSVIVDYFFDIREDANWIELKLEQPHLVDLVLKDSSARANVSMKILA